MIKQLFLAASVGMALIWSGTGFSQDMSVLPGDWACYGFEEQGETAYVADFDMLLDENGGWTSSGSFGEESATGAGLPFLWDYEASGSWAVRGGEFIGNIGSIRFLPTRGGEDYEAANPRDYLRLPLEGNWSLALEDAEFMLLQSAEGQLLLECSKQIYYDEQG
jgi:hypothetical protein